jgi:hypothetical protein
MAMRQVRINLQSTNYRTDSSVESEPHREFPFMNLFCSLF